MTDDRAVEAAPLAELAADVKRRAIELIDGMPDREAAALADLMERIADLTDAAKAVAAATPFLTPQIPDGWKPIDTAPKDGRQILAFARGSSTSPLDVFYSVAQWAEKADWMPNSVAGWFWSYAIRPTHWQPLPPPPQERTDG